MAYWDGSRWIEEPSTAPRPQRQRGLLVMAPRAIAISALVLGVTAGSVLAAKGGKPAGASSIQVVEVSSSVTALATADLRHGDTVTFDVSTTATERPYVLLNCYQEDAWVYASQAGFWAGYVFSQNFTLASSSWPSGAAACTARLGALSVDGTRFRELARTEFAVAD